MPGRTNDVRSLDGRGVAGRPPARLCVVVLALGLAVGVAGCAAVDQALTDGGDAALVENASARIPDTTPVDYRSRPIEFTVGLASTNGAGGQLVTPAGACGFLGDGSWRAVVDETTTWNTQKDMFSPWVSIAIVGEVPDGAPSRGDDAAFGLAQTPAVARLGDRETGDVVEYPGLLRVQPSGLVASFTADPEAFGAPEGSPRPTDYVVQVECETRPDEAD